MWMDLWVGMWNAGQNADWNAGDELLDGVNAVKHADVFCRQCVFLRSAKRMAGVYIHSESSHTDAV